jgi:hypothetical protein
MFVASVACLMQTNLRRKTCEEQQKTTTYFQKTELVGMKRVDGSCHFGEGVVTTAH